jgi:hypothetical protein
MSSAGAGFSAALGAELPEPSTWVIGCIGFMGLMKRRRTSHQIAVIWIVLTFMWLAVNGSASAELSKGHRILVERGLQVQGVEGVQKRWRGEQVAAV